MRTGEKPREHYTPEKKLFEKKTFKIQKKTHTKKKRDKVDAVPAPLRHHVQRGEQDSPGPAAG